MKDLDTYQVVRNLIKANNQLRMKFGVREREVWEVKRHGQIERDQENEDRIALNEYIEFQ